MTVASTLRRAGPYTGNGATTEFAFSFKIFEDSELIVARSSDNGEETLVLNTDYTVSLNANQDISPGGKVVLKKALAEGIRLAIISNVPYNQLAVFTNKGGFYPETLNEVDDKQTILSQQLLEKVERAIVTDPTDSMTPQELKQKLLDAAETATVVAKGYAEAAKKSEEKTAEYAEAAKVIAPISAEIKTTADHTDSVKTTADNIDAVKTVAANAEDVRSVAERIDDVSQVAKVAPHIDDVSSIKEHIDEVHRVGQDLVGMSSPYLDLGSVTETPDETTKVVDGYIKKVAEHIDDCIHPVGDNLDAVKTVAEQLAPINDVADLTRIDYEAIFLNGLHEEGDSNGLSN